MIRQNTPNFVLYFLAVLANFVAAIPVLPIGWPNIFVVIGAILSLLVILNLIKSWLHYRRSQPVLARALFVPILMIVATWLLFTTALEIEAYLLLIDAPSHTSDIASMNWLIPLFAQAAHAFILFVFFAPLFLLTAHLRLAQKVS